MSTFETMLNMQLSLFAIMMLGFFCRKKGMIDNKTRTMLSDLLINIILPCNIVMSFNIEVTSQLLKAAGIKGLILTCKHHVSGYMHLHKHPRLMNISRGR